MRIDLPCCGFKNCRYYSDGNCTDKIKYSDCQLSFLENYYDESTKNLQKSETIQVLNSLLYEVNHELESYIARAEESVAENNNPFNRGKLDAFRDICFILKTEEEKYIKNKENH